MKFLPSSCNPILKVGEPGSYDGRGAFRPSVVQYDNQFLVWYTGQIIDANQSYKYQTCFATVKPRPYESRDILKTEKHPNNPVIPCGAIPWSSGSNAEASILYIDHETALMAFSATNEPRCWGNIGLGFNRYFDVDYNIWEFEDQPLLSGGVTEQAYGNPYLLRDGNVIHLFFSKYRGPRQVWHMQSPLNVDNLAWSSPQEIPGYRDNLPMPFQRGITDWAPFYMVPLKKWCSIARFESELHMWSSPDLIDGGTWTYEQHVSPEVQWWNERLSMGGKVVSEWTGDPFGNEGRYVYLLWYDGQNAERDKNQSGIAFGV